MPPARVDDLRRKFHEVIGDHLLVVCPKAAAPGKAFGEHRGS
jgi:hypothetical protein